MTGPTVVAKSEQISKPRLHAKIMRGWARAIDRMGKGAFADAIECSAQALDKQLAGSMPSLETLDRALAAEPTILDDWLAARGFAASQAEPDFLRFCLEWRGLDMRSFMSARLSAAAFELWAAHNEFNGDLPPHGISR